MPKIYLCFLWHMHQPFYKDLVSGEYRLPWTRMHALKDYYGMAKILEDFPGIRQTFNLVPSMIVQVEEYARGEARDPFLECALKPAETLTAAEQAFILRNFFAANLSRMINRYPRYAELHTAHNAQSDIRDGKGIFGPQEFRDLQVLSQLAWFDEEFLEHDPEVRALVEKGRNFNHDDQALMGAQAARNLRAGNSGIQKAGGIRADRDFNYALLPSDHAAALRQRHRLGLASSCSSAAEILLSG